MLTSACHDSYHTCYNYDATLSPYIFNCIYYTHIYLYIHTYPHTCYMYVNTYTSLTRFCAPRLISIIIMTQPLYALYTYKLVHTYPHTRVYL